MTHVLKGDGHARPLAQYNYAPFRPSFVAEQHLHAVNRRSLAVIEQRLTRIAVTRWARCAAVHMRSHLQVQLWLLESTVRFRGMWSWVSEWGEEEVGEDGGCAEGFEGVCWGWEIS